MEKILQKKYYIIFWQCQIYAISEYLNAGDLYRQDDMRLFIYVLALARKYYCSSM